MKKIVGILPLVVIFISVTGKSQPIDSSLTDLARYLGGLPCLTSEYQQLQNEDSYKEHRTFATTTWKYFSDSTLIPARKWAEEKLITEKADTGTCFYPFSGPDYLFAHTFFPWCKQYVMMGLERCGTVKKMTNVKKDDRANYLVSVRTALRYLVRSGYFVTSHMGSDLSKSHLNGTVHMILYFAARTGHHIHALEYGYIDAKGKFISTGQKPSSQYFTGMHITMSDTLTGNLKNIFYYSCDIADYKIKTKDHLTPYVKSLGEVNTYLKSASYIPLHKNFSIIRNAILKNSRKILQDDTGVPYKSIKDTSIFEYNMWGTYSTTIKELEWGFQSDLKADIKKSPNNKSLPFRISYNGNYGEGLMMYARRKSLVFSH
ncbi:MAG: hypothetical protein ACHQF2_03145 [Flavobacteriales bacterium]